MHGLLSSTHRAEATATGDRFETPDFSDRANN